MLGKAGEKILQPCISVLWTPAATGARVLRVFGDTPCPAVPAAVAGRPVTEIGPYCFSARREPEGGALWGPEGADGAPLHPLCGDFVQEVTLPQSVRALHNGAFYNCRRLRRVTAGPALRELGSDLFTNCRSLAVFCLLAAPDEPTGLKKLLAAAAGDIAAEFAPGGRVQARMFCPEYQETLHENTPAHIFNHSIEGVGYRYRQCFAGGVVDWAEYDAAFLRADATEPPAALCRVALGRLLFPFALGPAARAQYEDYLRSHADAALALAVQARAEAAVRLLAPLAPDGCRQAAALQCGRTGWSEGAALLLAGCAPIPRRKTYDFDDL